MVLATILVVHHEIAVRHMFVGSLARAGYTVIEAVNAEETLEHALAVDLILLDVDLPDLSGYAVCRWLKANEATCLIPVIQVSARYRDSSALVVGKSGDADGVLVRQTDTEALFSLVATLLASSQYLTLRARKAVADARRTIRHATEILERFRQTVAKSQALYRDLSTSAANSHRLVRGKWREVGDVGSPGIPHASQSDYGSC